ncbi:hypothetical protein [Ruegeria arenilitoris]|uniref:hypothetical protein n=1 Tax=Ruegeria arenilitoris TaxID=1173585 RepID=UPI00147EE436|nr:hypothetical protein [Ruegeria arenilitoris]
MLRTLQLVIFCGIVLVGFLAPRPSLACGVCVTLPEYSLADRILSSRVIVLAAPSPDNPFKFVPVKVLKGTSDQLARAPEIPFLVDSSTRAAFRADPNRRVLMIYGSSLLDKTGRGLSAEWSKAFLVTPERAEFLSQVRSSGQSWGIGQSDSRDRIEFFTHFLEHHDRVLRDTALLEIHRAPYPIVRELGITVSTDVLRQDLRTVGRYAYAPAAIRLLGLQKDSQAREFVRSQYSSSLKTGGLSLREWAVAGIEADGSKAVAQIGNAIAENYGTQDDLKALIRALADAGAVAPEHREQISEVFKQTLEDDPASVVWIAAAVNVWEDDTLNSTFEALLASDETPPAAQFLIRNLLETEDPG